MKYLKIFTDFMDVVESLSDGSLGRLFRAMLLYARDGTEPALKGREAVAWAVAKLHIDRETAAYGEKVSSMERARTLRKQIEIKQKPVSAPLISGEDKDKENNNDKYKYNDNDISFIKLYPEKWTLVLTRQGAHPRFVDRRQGGTSPNRGQ